MNKMGDRDVRMLNIYTDEMIDAGHWSFRQPDVNWLISNGYEYKLKRKEKFQTFRDSNEGLLPLYYRMDCYYNLTPNLYLDEWVKNSDPMNEVHINIVCALHAQKIWVEKFHQRCHKMPSFEEFVDAVRDLGMWYYEASVFDPLNALFDKEVEHQWSVVLLEGQVLNSTVTPYDEQENPQSATY